MTSNLCTLLEVIVICGLQLLFPDLGVWIDGHRKYVADNILNHALLLVQLHGYHGAADLQ